MWHGHVTETVMNCYAIDILRVISFEADSNSVNSKYPQWHSTFYKPNGLVKYPICT